jgi:hypothetical protein
VTVEVAAIGIREDKSVLTTRAECQSNEWPFPVEGEAKPLVPLEVP